MHIPECSFLTVENFSLNFVSFLVHSEEKHKLTAVRIVFMHLLYLIPPHLRSTYCVAHLMGSSFVKLRAENYREVTVNGTFVHVIMRW